MNAPANASVDLSLDGRRQFLEREKRPLLAGDWTRALFLHYEVPADVLRPFVPFDLDLWEGKAFVSAVAFSMERLRPGFGGVAGRWLFWPIANHDFLNVRAYVRHGGQPGIYFISEWLNNRWCVLGGPWSYGLPYRFGRIRYDHHPEEGRLAGAVADGFSYTARIAPDVSFRPCAAGSVDEFLLERYSAFTRRGQCLRRFDIWHDPWPQAAADAEVRDDRLLRRTLPWFGHARWVGANYSPGAHNVWIGAPRRIS
jgi:uncharacterized protein YqjF (DUF2071 family)